MNKKLITMVFAVSVLIWQSCTNTNMMENKAIDIANMDTTVNPGDDFDAYANGGWKQLNPIPEDKSTFGSFNLLIDNNELQVKELINGIKSKDHAEGTVEQKIADFINTGMDTIAIEEMGLEPLTAEFEKINSISDIAGVKNQILHFNKTGVSTVYAVYANADAKNSNMVVTYLYQSGLGMPDRDYYLSDNERFVDIKTKYTEHLVTMFSLMGNDESTATESASTIMQIETRLAKASMDRSSLRDPHKTYNKTDLDSLDLVTPNMNWKSYFKELGLGDPGVIIVAQPDFFAEVNSTIIDISVEDWKTYFKWNLINANANYLSKEFVEADFNFYGKTLSGTPENRLRWKRVLGAANSYLGEAIGQAYVKEYFPPEAKVRMLALVENLKTALGERIDALDWMGMETKKNAQEKLATINVKVGYPDKWKDYTTLEVKKDAYVLNIMRARSFSFNEMMAKINKPVDKTEWHMPPQVVNAYYSPLQNEIVFPAGILQPPFFYMDADDAVNYGAIGVVIGHEMTHGFDDKGRLYDKDGNLNTWWTEEDNEKFNAKAEVLVNQFNNYKVLDTTKANGKYTLGENIADLGGLNIAYTAFKKTKQWTKQENKIANFTPNQRFYLSYAHLWAQNIRDKEILRRTQEDVHSLGSLRVLGPLRNIPEFYEAFNIEADDYMYLSESERAVIW